MEKQAATYKSQGKIEAGLRLEQQIRITQVTPLVSMTINLILIRCPAKSEARCFNKDLESYYHICILILTTS